MVYPPHPSSDEALSFLAATPGALGQFVQAYPGARESDDLDWLDRWFHARAISHQEHSIQDDNVLFRLDQSLIHSSGTEEGQITRLKSVEPHFFRGFRTVPNPISFDDDFIVIDGRNSSGKTSLAEAIEWLFTGSLSRRDVKDLGNPRELENCIGNQFRPADEQTWVEVVFAVGEGSRAEDRRFKRILTQDYGTTSTSLCESLLYLNDTELSSEQEHEELDRLFAGVPPLLMQHTLRLFVESTPARRREYFERLLRLDELTDLIRHAVIGDARFETLASTNGNTGLSVWNDLGAILPPGDGQRAHRQAARTDVSDANRIREVLAAQCASEFLARLNILPTAPELSDSPTSDDASADQEEEQGN